MTRAKKGAPVTPPEAPLHRIVPSLLQRRVRVLVVGCGGSGSEIISGLPYLHQAMLAHGHPGGLDVLIMDGDVVSETNTVRQPFALGDVGHPKATLLAGRVNAFWGLTWRALPRHLTAAGRDTGDGLACDLVIGCVDSRAARRLIHARVQADRRVSYWLDLGNDAASGQFVLGQPPRIQGKLDPEDFIQGKGIGKMLEPRSHHRLPTVAELYPETIDVAGDKRDTRPSCSAVEALTRQEPFVNRALAGQALAMLARLFRYGELAYHGGFVNLATGRTMSLPVAPESWARITAMNSTHPTRRRKSTSKLTRRSA